MLMDFITSTSLAREAEPIITPPPISTDFVSRLASSGPRGICAAAARIVRWNAEKPGRAYAAMSSSTSPGFDGGVGDGSMCRSLGIDQRNMIKRAVGKPQSLVRSSRTIPAILRTASCRTTSSNASTSPLNH